MKMKRMILSLVTGLLVCGTQAFGISLVSENFNDVTNPATNAVLTGADNPTISAIVAAHPSQLPTGTTGTGTGGNATALSVNVRSSTNSINVAATNPGNFRVDPVNPNLFTTNFLVIGDNSSSIFREAHSTTSGGIPSFALSMFSIPFTNALTGGTLDVSFKYAFNGWDSIGNENRFQVYLDDGTNPNGTKAAFDLINYVSPLRPYNATTPPANYISGIFQKLNISTAQFASQNLLIHFKVYEFAPASGANGINSNVAAGIDDITIDYTPAAVPEPSTFILLGAGLGGLALLRRRRG